MTERLFAWKDDVDAAAAEAATAAAEAAQAAAEAAQAAAEAAAASLTTEALQDIVGAMFSANTETLIAATYEDSDGTIDLVVEDDLSLYDNATSAFLTAITAGALFQPLDSDLTRLAEPSAIPVDSSPTASSDYVILFSGTGAGYFRTLLEDMPGGGTGGASAFIDLTDAPSAYTGEASRVVAVNAGETGVEFSSVLTLTTDGFPILNLGAVDYSGLVILGTSPDTGGPSLYLQHDSATPEDFDQVGTVSFSGRDDALNAATYAHTFAYATDVSNGSEDGEYHIQLQRAGVLADALTLDPTGLAIFDFAAIGFPIIRALTTAGGFGPYYVAQTDAAVPAANDDLGGYEMWGKDSAGNNTVYCSMFGTLLDPTNTTEDSSTTFQVQSAGTNLAALTLSGLPLSGFGGGYSDFIHLDVGGNDYGTAALTSTAPGNGPIFAYYFNSASPAANDLIGSLDFVGKNSAAADAIYGYISLDSTDVTNGTEDSRLRIMVRSGGAAIEALTIGATTYNSLTGSIFNVGSADSGNVYVEGSYDGGFGPQIAVYSNSATPTVNDILGYFCFTGEDSAGNATEYAFWQGEIADPTNISEDSRISAYILSGGSQINVLMLDSNGAIVNANVAAGGFTTQTSNEGADGGGIAIGHVTTTPAASDKTYINFYQASDTAFTGFMPYNTLVSYTADVGVGTETGTLEFLSMYAGAQVITLDLNTGSPYPFTQFDVQDGDYAMFQVKNSSPDTGGPQIATFHDSPSAANLDDIGTLLFTGYDSGTNVTSYGYVQAYTTDITNGSEDGAMRFCLMRGGVGDFVTLELGNTAFWSGGPENILRSNTGGFGLNVINTDPDGTGAYITLLNDTATPAADDNMGVSFYSRDSAANLQAFGSYTYVITDPTNGSEDSWAELAVFSGGSIVSALTLGAPDTPWNSGIAGSHIFRTDTVGAGVILHTTNAGPEATWFQIHHDSATPADEDSLGQLFFDGNNDAATKAAVYAGVGSVASDVSNGTEDSRLEFGILSGGLDLTALTLGATGAAGDYVHSFSAGGVPYGGVAIANTSTDNGPALYFLADSATPAANDDIGSFITHGRDSGGNLVAYCFQGTYISDPTNGSEDSIWYVAVTTAGTLADELYLTGTALYPATNLGLDLGDATHVWRDLYLDGSSLKMLDTDDSHFLSIQTGSNLTANHTLTLTTGDADRTLNLSAGGITVSDAGFDVLAGWDDSVGSLKNFLLADIGTEAAPAAGDYVLIYGAEGDLRKVNWSGLPGAGGGISNVVEDATPQLGGDLDLNAFSIIDATYPDVLVNFGSDRINFNVAGSNTLFEFSNTDDGNTGAQLRLMHSSNTPAADDVIGRLIFGGVNTAPSVPNYASIYSTIVDPTATTEDASLKFEVKQGGSDLVALTLAPTYPMTTNFGGDPGAPVTFNFGNDTGSNYPGVNIELSTADNSSTAGFAVHADSATPAANDFIGWFGMHGEDSAGNYTTYSEMQGYIVDPINGSEDSSIVFRISSAGSSLNALTLGAAAFDGSFGHVFDGGSTNSPSLTFQNSSAGAGGPYINLYHNSASPAASDGPGGLYILGKDSAGNDTYYGYLASAILDPTNGTEDSRLQFNVIRGGVDVAALIIGATADGRTEFQAGDDINPYVFYMTGSGLAHTVFQYNSDDANGPAFELYHNSATPADSDEVGSFHFYGNDDAAGVPRFAQMNVLASDVSAGTEDASLSFSVIAAGAEFTALTLGPDVTLGADLDLNGFNAVDGASLLHLWSDGSGATIEGSANFSGLNIQNDNNDTGVFLFLTSNTASPADGDGVGYVQMWGKDDTAGNVAYGQIYAVSADVSNGTEDGELRFTVYSAGAEVVPLTLDGSGAFFLSGAKLDFNAGDVTLTHSANLLTLAGGNLTVPAGGLTVGSGVLTLSANLTIPADPNADRMLFWDDSAGATDWLTLGNGLTITTTTIAVDSASDTVDGIMEIAIQSEMETGTDTTRAVSPGRQHFHPSAAKTWGKCSGNASTVQVSYNLTSVTNGAAGINTWTIGTDFSSGDYAIAISHLAAAATTNLAGKVTSQAAGSFDVITETSSSGADTDPTNHYMVAFGDHA